MKEFIMRMTPEQREALAKRAYRENVSEAELVRRLIREKAESELSS